MSLKSLSLILATTAVAALTLPALAQDKTGVNVGAAAEGAAPGAASTMGLAQELYALGVVQGDAVTVLAAAKLAEAPPLDTMVWMAPPASRTAGNSTCVAKLPAPRTPTWPRPAAVVDEDPMLTRLVSRPPPAASLTSTGG